MGLFQRDMRILKNWYGGQLDSSLDSGSGTKSPRKILQVSHDYLIRQWSENCDNSRELSLPNPECQDTYSSHPFCFRGICIPL